MKLLLAAVVAMSVHAQTRIASDIEIRQMQEAAQSGEFATKVTAHINLGELRKLRNEPAAAEREFQDALQLARLEREDARKKHELPRYAVACGWVGVALASLGRGVEAFEMFEEAVRYAADSRGVWNVYSVGMYQLDKPEKAIGAARMSVHAAERTVAGGRATVREMLELNVDRFALAQGLLNSGSEEAGKEAEELLLKITASLDSDAFAALRKSLARREEFQVLTTPTTEGGIYLSIFNRSHSRLARFYEAAGAAEKAILEFKAVVSRRSDEAMALGGLARLTKDPKERDQYFIQSLDANPFADDVIADYEHHVALGQASAPAQSGSAGSRVRLVVHQMQAREFRQARETLKALMAEHPGNDVLQAMLARLELKSGDAEAARAAADEIADPAIRWDVIATIRRQPVARPWFLDKQPTVPVEPAESDLRTLLNLFARNTMSAADRATLDRAEFTSNAELESLERGTIHGVPFRFQSAARFRGIPETAKKLRLVYRILGATTLDERDALLLEPIRATAEVEK
jgi:tetratricopeptide (TPR) repeat protein